MFRKPCIRNPKPQPLNYVSVLFPQKKCFIVISYLIYFVFFVRNSSKLTLSISGGVTKNQESLTQILWRQKWV